MSRTLLATSPLSTGDIVGRSFRIFRQNLLLIAKSLLTPTIIICLGRIGVLVGAAYGAKFINNIGAGVAWFVLAIFSLFVLFTGVAWLWVKQLVLVRFLTGKDETFQEASKFVNNRILSLVILFLAATVVSFFFLLFWAVVMVLAFPPLQGQGIWPYVGSFGMAAGILGLFLSVVFITMVYNLVSMALTLENGQLGDQIGEGVSLTLRSFWRSIGFLCMTMTAITIVAYPLTLPIILSLAAYIVIQGAAMGNSPEALPISLQVLNSVWETGVNMIIGPIYYLSYALYYRDLRMRLEGLDIVERLEEVDKAEVSGRLSSHGI